MLNTMLKIWPNKSVVYKITMDTFETVFEMSLQFFSWMDHKGSPGPPTPGGYPGLSNVNNSD